jgi:hypothetical protein
MGELKCEFRKMCMQDSYVIKAKPTTSHNQQTISKYNQSIADLPTINDQVKKAVNSKDMMK